MEFTYITPSTRKFDLSTIRSDRATNLNITADRKVCFPAIYNSGTWSLITKASEITGANDGIAIGFLVHDVASGDTEANIAFTGTLWLSGIQEALVDAGITLEDEDILDAYRAYSQVLVLDATDKEITNAL